MFNSKWLPLALGASAGVILVVVIIMGLGLRAGCMIFDTAVEREVFEQSIQHSSAETQQYNTLTAELEGVEVRLQAGNLTDTQRADLEAHAAMLRVQIRQMGGGE